MAINPNNGVLDIINGTLKVSSIDIKQAGGFTTAINTVARNDVLLYDDQHTTTTFTPTQNAGYSSSSGVTRDTTAIDLNDGWVYWPLQLPNSWHTEFDMHVTTTGGVLTYSIFNTSEPNHTDFTNNDGGYKIVFDNTQNQIDVRWEGSVHATTPVNLRSTDWQHVNINYFQGAVSISLAGKVVLTHKFSENYQEFDSRYVGFSATSGASHKIRHLIVHNSDKWLYTKTSNASDITYVSGNVGIGTLTPTELLDVHGNVHVAKDLTVNGNLTVSGTTTFIDTQNLAIEDPIIEVARGNASDTIDAGLVITRATSNVAVAYRGDEEELALGYTQSGASDTDVTPIADGGLDVRVYGNLFANNLTTTANVEASYINGNVVTSNLMVSGEYTMGGRIIPDTNDAYDIGSAEKKIRDLYVADNSLWIGDETKISFASGKMRFRKRKKNVVPAAILAAGGTATAAKTFSSKANLNDIKSHEWLKYMKTLGGKGNAIMSDVFRNNDDDYEATTAAEAWKDINDDIFSESNVSIGKTSSPTVTLDVEGDGKFSGNVVTTGNIGIRTATPSANLHVMGYQYVNGPPTLTNSFDHSDAPLTLTHDTATSSTAINDPKPLLHLTRSGTNNESYGARASFNLSRYENSSTHSRSRLDVALADGTYAESTVMTLRADGKVGVGTDTPAYTLDVAGDINLSGDFYQGGSPFVSSLWTDGTDSLYYRSNVEVGTANLFVDTTTSNVGIGTSTPAYTLDVAGDINLSGDFYQGGSPFVSSLWTENVGKLYYNGGNVGIGTTSPGYKLDVHGSANVGALTVTSVTGLEAADIPNLDASKITTGTLNNARLPASINVTNVSGNGSGLTSLNADNISSGTLNNARLPTSINVTNVSGNGSGLTSLNADNISSGTLNNARLTDASTTAKGIVQLSSSTGGASTTKAATESAVKAAYDRNSWGSGSFSSDVNITGGSFRVGNSNGTSQPQFFVKNEVNATDTDENDRALLQLKAGDSDHNGFLMDLDDDDTYSANGNNEFVFKIRTKDNAIADAADADTKFVIRPSGRILVNYGSTYKLTNPSDPYLAVNGDISSSGTITATSSVGIGMTSPGYKLDVAGDINISSGSVFRINGTALANSATITASASAGNSTLVQRHSDGYIFANYFNTTPNDVASGVTKVCVETGNDGYIRHGTSAAISTFLGLANSATIEATTADTANKIAQRNGSGDIFARLFRSDYQNQSTCTGAIAFRTSTSDNYIRFCSDMGAVRSRIGAYGNGSNITRTAHSNGYMIGSYNNVGSNEAKTNPIYTIGSNYKPSDTSLGNMYGIGYSHGNFTSILTGGWGMYVAADGDARIGLNASSGHIKNTGHIYCGNTLYIGGSTSRGLRSVSGNYGTVQTTGGGAGDWEGYSIDGRFVFMSADNNRCGIYNDLDNEWMIYCYRNSYVKLYYNGGAKLETLSGGVKIHGSLTATGNVTAYSDIRHKKDIVKLDNALEKVEKLNGYTYTRINDGKRYTGLIAQEVLEVLPEAVIADEKGDYSLAYGNMAGLFVEAMKEMKSKLDTALARLDALENIRK